MIIRNLSGEDQINNALMLAMQSTISALVDEKLLDRTIADDFLENHICLMVAHEGAFKSWLEKFLKIKASKDAFSVITAKANR